MWQVFEREGKEKGGFGREGNEAFEREGKGKGGFGREGNARGARGGREGNACQETIVFAIPPTNYVCKNNATVND